MKSVKDSVLFKLSIILVLIVILMVPMTLVQNLIEEREEIQLSAIKEVSSKWGSAQTITGPILSIPFNRYKNEKVNELSKQYTSTQEGWVHFLPEELKIDGTVFSEKRYRGIYEIVVYESALNLSGTFSNLEFEKLGLEGKHLRLDKAIINVGVSDLKGIEKQVSLEWGDQSVLFNSGVQNGQLLKNGINTPVNLKNKENDSIDFSFDIALKGSENIQFIPIGKTTQVNLSSNWETPSFCGNYLPDEREITADGFVAKWNILNLNRNFPQSWIGNEANINSSVFGTNLLLPVDNYKKSYRVARYALLFLGLTFLVFFFVEVMQKVFIHPIQYLLVGIALVIFYTLLISISEHLTFNIAYIISSFLTIGLITFYATSILKSKQVGFMMFSLLAILYTFTFTIIQLEGYALLIGSLGIFIILGVVMFFSRKIDWYSVTIKEIVVAGR